MKLRIIKSEIQYDEYLDWVDTMFDQNIDPNSAEGEKLQIALMLVKQYEDIHYEIPFPDPIEVIKLKMEESGIRNKDLVTKNYGSKGHISSLLNKRKPLTLDLAKRFHKEFGIPADVLLA
jgi:HTH-type transcriptional regulator/antitoxin HigA